MLNPAFALLAWPLVALVLFAKLPVQRAIVWSLMSSTLFLPASFEIDLPVIPPLDKESLPSLVMLLVLLGKYRLHLGAVPGLAQVLFGALLLGSFGTVMVNPEPIWNASGGIAGLTAYDGFSGVVRIALQLAPFFVGWRFLGGVRAHQTVLEIVFKLGMFYSLLMLFEVRMSPQLHQWVYGYFPHGQWSQNIRADGYRPVVFFSHGLWNSFFAMSVLIATAGLWAESRRARSYLPFGLPQILPVATSYMFVVVVLCKSMGSLMQSVALLPLVLLTRPRFQVAAAALMAAIAITYPLIRGVGLVPTDSVMEFVSSLSEDRAGSLGIRLRNEDILLERSEEKPVFGWGTWGRNRVYDPQTGEDISITDGYWVMVIGSKGWTGYVAIFGMLGLPVLTLRRRLAAQGSKISPSTACLALLVGVNMIELIPNSTLPPWLWLFAGALLSTRSERAADAIVSVSASTPNGPARRLLKSRDRGR